MRSDEMLGFLVAVPAAVLAAACFGTAGVLQHRAAHKTPERKPLRPGLLADLIRMQGFQLGVLLGAAGFALQVCALAFGPLILVQPLLVTGVLFYLAVASALGHHQIDRRLTAGALTALAGLAAFLVVARPTEGQGRFQGADALPLGVLLAIVVSASLAAAARLEPQYRSLVLAVATAVCYGVTAALVRSLTSLGQHTQGDLLLDWQLWAVIVVGPAGFLLNQNAYQSGVVGSMALAVITVGDPLVSIGAGVVWLGERIHADSWSVFGEVIALTVMAVGVIMLARRAQQVADVLQARHGLPEGT
jgi:drug/metabolite transporter (DMT)-like permease